MTLLQAGWETFQALTLKRKMLAKRSTASGLMSDMSGATEDAMLSAIMSFVPGSVAAHKDEENDEEKWYNAVRPVATLFVNLGLDDSALALAASNDKVLQEVHGVLAAVQTAVYQYEGAINKFLLDDKGSTLISCFGLAPNAHEDDAARAALAGLNICERLLDLGYRASVGITFGDVFCGVVGSRGRREYSILGDPVNLAARLMQAACTERGGVIVDSSVADACRERLAFTSLGSINVKGKVDAINIYSPYPPLPPTLRLPWHVSSNKSGGSSSMSGKVVPPQDAGAFASAHSKYGTDAPAFGKVPPTPSDDFDDGNLYRHFHLRQLEIQATWRQLRSLQGYFDRRKDIADRSRAWRIGGGDGSCLLGADALTPGKNQANGDTTLKEDNVSSGSALMLPSSMSNGSTFAAAMRGCGVAVPFSWSAMSKPAAVGRRQARLASSASFRESSASAAPPPLPPPSPRKRASFNVPIEEEPSSDKTSSGAGSDANESTVRKLSAKKSFMASAAAPVPPPTDAAKKPAFYAGQTTTDFLGDDYGDNVSDLKAGFIAGDTDVASLGGAIFGDGAFPHVARSPPLQTLNGLIPVGTMPKSYLSDDARRSDVLASTDDGNANGVRTAGSPASVTVIVTVDPELLRYGGEIEPFQLPTNDNATFWDLFEAASRAAVKAGAERVRRQHGRTSTAAFGSSGSVVRSMRDSVATPDEAGYKAGHTGYSDDSGDDSNDVDDGLKNDGEGSKEKKTGAVEEVGGDPEARRVRRLVASLLKDATLVVTGTRMILPTDRDDPMPLSVLPLFIAEALRMRSGLPQDNDLAATIADLGFISSPGSNTRPVRVSFVRKASLPGLSSRAVAARTALLSAQCRLLLKHPSSKSHYESEHGKGTKAGGLHLLTGPPGAGKSFLVSSSLVDAVPPRAAAAIYDGSYCNDDDNDSSVKALMMRYTVAATPMVAHARRPGELPPPQRAAPWAFVVAQYLDHRAAADSTVPTKEHALSASLDGTTTDSSTADARKVNKTALAHTTATRTAQLTVELQAMDPSGALLKRAHVLNPFLSTSLTSPELSSGQPNQEEVEALLFELLKRLAAWRPSIVLIDDCHYLDQGSWRLSVAVATGALPTDSATTMDFNTLSDNIGLALLCIMVGRPVAFRGLYQRLSPASILAQNVAATSAQLDGLPSEVLEGIYLSALGHGVRALSGDLFVLLERTCLGVPGIALEFLGNLCAKGLLRFLRISSHNLPKGNVISNASSESASNQGCYLADLSLDFRAILAKDGGGDRYLSASLAINLGLVPITACRHLGAVADRLTSVQTLLLTTVAVLVADTNQVLASSRSLSAEAQASMRGAKALDVIGTRELDGSASGACFPAKEFSYDRLEKELLDLVARGILVDLTQQQSAHGAAAVQAKADAAKNARRLSASSSSLSSSGQAAAASLWSGNFVAPIERLLVGFARPFMAETVLAGMLGEHVAAVERQGRRNEEEHDKDARERMAKKMAAAPLPDGAALLHGRVHVRKSELSANGAAAAGIGKSSNNATGGSAAVTSLRRATRSAFRRHNNTGGGSASNEGNSMTADSDWKDRYLALINKKLVIFYSEKDYLRSVSGSLSAKDCTTIDLGTAVLDKDGGNEKDDEDDIEGNTTSNNNSHSNAAGNGPIRGGMRRLASSASASSGPKVRSAAQRKAASFRSAPTPSTKEPSKPNRVKVELEPFASFRSDGVIALTSQRSVKNGKLSLATRTWYMEATSATDASKWIYLMRFVMEEAAAKADVARLFAVKQTPAMSKRARKQFFKLKLNLGFLRSFTRQWRFDSWGHARLAVSLRAARGVLNPHNLGVPHVYAKLCLVKTSSTTTAARGPHDVVSPVLVSPVSHPPSSSPSWEGLGPSALAFCPTFLFSKLDELVLKDRKETLLSDLGARVSAGLAPYVLHVELWSAEQLVADESLGAALVPLTDLIAVDYSDRFDKSQPRIEEEATAAVEAPASAAASPAGEDNSSSPKNPASTGSHSWRKLKASPGKFSALIDPAVSANAAVSLAVKLVVCRRPIFHADRGPTAETSS